MPEHSEGSRRIPRTSGKLLEGLLATSMSVGLALTRPTASCSGWLWYASQALGCTTSRPNRSHLTQSGNKILRMVNKAPRQCFGDFHFSPPTCPLRPVIPNNTCPPRLTAAAGTELAGASSSSPVMIETRRKSLTSDSALLHPRDIAGSGVSPLSNIPHCCPPRESGPCLSPSVADHPKRPAKHHWLGQP